MYGPKVVLLTNIKPEYSDILYNPTHFPGPLVCRIRQVLCTIDTFPWSLGVSRFWHPVQYFPGPLFLNPVQSDTFPWSLGVSEQDSESCTINLVCRIRQKTSDTFPWSCVGLDTIQHISLVPWCVRLDILYNQIRQVLILYNITFPWSLGVSDYRILSIQHISLVPWCVGLDRIWHPVQSDTFPWSLGVSD